MEKDFWRCITRDEIITDYNTKAVNVDAYQRRDNNSDTAGKVENETRQQMNNLFQRLCSVRSFCCRESIFSYLRRAVFILSQANFYSIHFLKVRHFPGKIDNKPLPGVFLEAALPLQETFKKVLRPIFLWRGTCREFVARLAASRPKKLAPLAKKLVKLDFAVVSMGFSEALSSFSHFS